ncbi:MAG: hypothetical protein M3373_11025 [Gemmatimonadota bacterium]|nr:hypothetical protein [Gemmatimonadota bacterium]
MTTQPRSLKYEYALFVEQEIEAYKESIPRGVLLRIGDEAVAVLEAAQQLALTELLLTAEVDRIIRGRVRIPAYRTWCRRRTKALQEFRRPERWGLRPDGAVARAVQRAAESGGAHVLVAGSAGENPAVFLAANGCAVTAIDSTEEVLERVIHAAVEVGIGGRVRGFVGDLASWAPDLPLDTVVCAAAAFAGLTPTERAEAIAILQGATTRGGMHIVESPGEAAGGCAEGDDEALSLDELAARYDGWTISVERGETDATFLATKVA